MPVFKNKIPISWVGYGQDPACLSVASYGALGHVPPGACECSPIWQFMFIYTSSGQWWTVDRLWTTHIFTFQQQIHSHLTLHSAKRNYSAALNNMMLIHWPLMDRLLHLVQRGGDWPIRSRPGPSSLYQM